MSASSDFQASRTVVFHPRSFLLRPDHGLIVKNYCVALAALSAQDQGEDENEHEQDKQGDPPEEAAPGFVLAVDTDAFIF